jgi:hypothetical protein
MLPYTSTPLHAFMASGQLYLTHYSLYYSVNQQIKNQLITVYTRVYKI